jgi:hypothetical protein
MTVGHNDNDDAETSDGFTASFLSPIEDDDDETKDASYLIPMQPSAVTGSARAFQRDLFFYWSAVRSHPLSLTRQDRLYRKDLRRVNAALLQPELLEQDRHVPNAFRVRRPDAHSPISGRGRQETEQVDELDVPRLLFMRLLMTDLGLLTRKKQAIQIAARPPFLERELAERVQIAFAHWRDGTFWNEALSIPGVTIKGAGTRLDPAPQAIVRARKQAIKLIAAYQATLSPHLGGWIAVLGLTDYIRREDYGFLIPREDRSASSDLWQTNAYQGRMLAQTSQTVLQSMHIGGGYISPRSPYISYGNEMSWSFSPPFVDEAEGWETVEAGFVRAILFEPMFWMGLLDVGFVSGQPVAYRLTPVGEWLLGIGPAVEFPEQEGRVIVQPNFEIYALDPVSDRTLAALDEFADRASAERAIKYSLTRESVYRAQRRGWNAARIIRTLEKMIQAHDVTQDHLPQNVVRTLEEWQRLHERIRIHRHASLLQAVDADLLAQLMTNPSIAAHLTAPSTAERQGADQEPGTPQDSAVLIAPGLSQVEELAQALQAAGYPPARTRYEIVGAPTFTPERCMTISPDGRLHFDVSLPSIHILGMLAPFTVCDERHDQHYLTQQAVERAIEGGMTVQQILERLRALHRPPLPRWIEIKVRAWGHYYGNAAVQTVTLVQIRDTKTLDELLADPEIGRILRRFVSPQGSALAVVDAEDTAALYEALAERGIEVQEGSIGQLDL